VTVLDASALLAFLQGEDGADVVEAALETGAVAGAANWSEVAQKVLAHGRDWNLARALLLSHGLQVEDVTADDAERAAARWGSGAGLSLGDRLCLALGERLGGDVLTADRAWGTKDGVRQIR
jgi:PIN domain nuclease of toxin-antitoxin system